MFLVANLVLQGFLIYMICKEERINDKFGGQMHLCNFGAGLPDCPDNPDCIGPRGTPYTPERLYSWEMWKARTFVRDSFVKMFPERLAEINELVDPGEYGLESYWLRLACCFLFVMGLWPDMMGSVDLLNMLYNVPTGDEAWMVYTGPEPDPVGVLGYPIPSEEMSNVKFRVAGMPMFWKIINLVFVAFPKLYIWVLMVDIGTLFLMETASIEDMIMNAVALSFILSIDELICAGLFNDAAKRMMENIEPLPLFEPEDMEGDRETWERHQIHRQWTFFTFELWNQVFSLRLFCMIGATAFFQFKYYQDHCVVQEDGSMVGIDLRMPLSDVLGFWNFVLGPVPGMGYIASGERTWHAASINSAGSRSNPPLPAE